MSRRIRGWAAVSLCALLAAGTAASAEPGTPGTSGEPDYDRSGPYVGAGGGLEFGTGSSGSSLGVGKLFGGYRINRYVAVDLDLQIGDSIGRTEYRGLGQIRLYPISGSWVVQPYLVAGVGFVTISDRPGTAGVLRPGCGVDFYVSEHIVITPVFGYEMFFDSSSFSRANRISFLGTLTYRF